MEERPLHEFRRVTEARSFQTVERLGEIDEPALSGPAQNAEGSGYFNSLTTCCLYSLSIIHQKQIGVKIERQSDRSPFSRATCTFRVCRRRWPNFQPMRRSCNPGAYQLR